MGTAISYFMGALALPALNMSHHRYCGLQLEEEIQADLKWCMTVEKVLHSGRSDFQSVELIESGPFGKVSDAQGGCVAFCTVDGGPFALLACRAAAVHTMRCKLGVCQSDMYSAAGLLLAAIAALSMLGRTKPACAGKVGPVALYAPAVNSLCW